MRIFTVLESPDGRPERVVVIQEGFSWGALLFTVMWALWHRMWVVAALLFAVTSFLTVAVALELLGPGLVSLLNFGISLVFACEARRLQEASLERAGFRHSGLIQASNAEAAELTYFSGRVPFAAEPASARRAAAHTDTLGIFGNV